MNERTPRKPGDPAGDGERGDAKSTPTDPPPSAVRPSTSQLSAPTGDPSKEDPASSEPAGSGSVAAGNGVGPLNKAPEGVDRKAKDANDRHAPPADDATFFARLANREWRRKIIGWLFLNKFLGKLTEDEAEEVFQSMCARVLSKGGWPAEEKPTLSWLFTAAFNTCIDFLRVRKRIRAHEVSIDDQDFPIETGDAEEAGHLKRYVAKQVVEKPAIARNVAILSDYVDGMEARDIAKKYGIKIGNVYQRKEKALEILRSGWLQVPAAAAVGFVILFLLINRIPRDNTVTSSHEHAAPNAPLLRLPPHPDPAELRRAALTECHVNEYEWCLKNLNHARRLDPAGETDPELIAARKDAEARMKERWDKKEH